MPIDRSSFVVRVRSIVAAGVLVAFSSTAYSFEIIGGKGIDFLELPALQSEKAAHSMLLGVATAGDRLVAVGERGIVVASDDHGLSWKQSEVPVSVTLNAVHFVSSDLGWIVGNDGVILRSENSGRSWVKVLDGNQANQLIINDLKARIGTIEGRLIDSFATEEGALRAELEVLEFRLEDAEAGASFGPSRPLLALWFKDHSLGFAVGSFGQAFRTEDGGEHWTSLSGALDNPDSLHLNAITRLAGGALAIAGERGTIWLSTDQGVSWRVSEVGYDGHLYGVIQVAPATLVSFGFAGSIFRSIDFGQTWEILERGNNKSVVGAVDENGERILLVARDGSVVCSRDAGKTFSVLREKSGITVAGVLPQAFGADKKIIVVGHGGVSMLETDEDRSDCR